MAETGGGPVVLTRAAAVGVPQLGVRIIMYHYLAQALAGAHALGVPQPVLAL